MKKETLYTISRWVMALLFIFSGLTKSVNPFGMSVQLGEYFSALGLEPLKPLAGLGGIVLPSLELLLGIMLVLGLARRVTAVASLIFMVFFTLLTLWIALTNPVSDCGCFGDVIKLSNWSTFIKNILLLPFAVTLYVNRGVDSNLCCKPWWQYTMAAVLSLVVAVYCHFNLPLIDSTPYKIGTNIAQAMSTPIGAQQDQIQTTLIYRNIATGTTREFAIADTTWQDESQWEYVDSRTTTLKEGFVPAIKSLPMIDHGGEDVAQQVLSTPGKVLLVVSNSPQDIDFSKIATFATQHSIPRTVVLTSIAELPIVPSRLEIYHSDPTVISTVIQNRRGGALLLDNGTIIEKYVMWQLQ